MTRLPGDPHLIARECRGPGGAPGRRQWARAVPSKRLKDLIEGTAGHRASGHWPALDEAAIR
jgi:hypothetical protein